MVPSELPQKILKKIKKNFFPQNSSQGQRDKEFSDPHRPLASRLVVGTTFKCAARCPHCYLLQQNNSVFQKQMDMAPALFQGLMNSPFTRDLKCIVFSGGEALLNPNVFDWMDQAKQRGIADIRIVSNGLSLLNVAIVDRLLEQKNITRFNISIDATTQEGYCRSKGIKHTNFEKICTQIAKIADRFDDTPTQITGSFVRNQFDFEDTHRIITFAQSIGLPKVQLTSYHKARDAHGRPSDAHTLKKYQALIDQVVAVTDYRIDITIQLPSMLARKRFFCHSLANYLCVSPNGTMAPCCHMPWDEKYGQFVAASANPINHPAIADMRSQFIKAAATQDLNQLPEQCKLCNKRTPDNALVFKAATQKWKIKSRSHA